MKDKEIRRQVRAFFKSSNLSNSYMGEFIHSAMMTGRQMDADAVLIGVIAETNVLQLGLVVGRSVLYGPEAVDHIKECCDAEGAVEFWVERAAEGLSRELGRKEIGAVAYNIVKIVGDERWRGFRGAKPKNVDEVRDAARNHA